jgi:hypothetical protein
MSTSSVSDENSLELLREDYRLKANYLNEHFGRMWTRFNFMLGVQLALFGFLGHLLFDKQNRDESAALLPIILGSLTSLLWFFVGVQDHFLVEEYRDSLIQAFKRVPRPSTHLPWTENDYVGYHRGGKWGAWRGWLSWYISPTSITTLPALFPLFALAAWVAAFLLWRFGVFWFAPIPTPPK